MLVWVWRTFVKSSGLILQLCQQRHHLAHWTHLNPYRWETSLMSLMPICICLWLSSGSPYVFPYRRKPYKCGLCSFCCSDWSILSHYQKHKSKMVLGLRYWVFLGSRNGRVYKRGGSHLTYSRRALINLSPPSTVVQEPDTLMIFAHEIPNIQSDSYESMAKTTPTEGLPRGPKNSMVDNPLSQLSTLAGQLSSLPLKQNLAPLM